MSNIRKKEFYDVITGESVEEDRYGEDAIIYKKSTNVDMIFDSHGQYLGIRKSLGKMINGKLTFRRGPYIFQSADELKYLVGIKWTTISLIPDSMKIQ